MNTVASIKDRLKNKSITTGKTVQELLTAYGLERTILRLSESKIFMCWRQPMISADQRWWTPFGKPSKIVIRR